MTVFYGSTNPLRLLLSHWRGSVFKAIWLELLLYFALFGCISLIQRFALTIAQQQEFDQLISQFDAYSKKIPIAWMLGFYVSHVMSRWIGQLDRLVWPEALLLNVVGALRGRENVEVRRACARWITLLQALVYRDISLPVRQRFATTELIEKMGLLTPQEHEVYKDCLTVPMRWQLPLTWIARQIEAKPPVHNILTNIYQELNEVRQRCLSLYMHDFVCLPLVYTQTAVLAVYGYFGACLIGQQIKLHDADTPDTYLPAHLLLEYLFYVGWLKVGQAFMRPFGGDDDDLDLNYLIDRNLRTALSLVDEVTTHYPTYSHDTLRTDYPTLPYTVGSATAPHHPKIHFVVDADSIEMQQMVMRPVNNSSHKDRQF